MTNHYTIYIMINVKTKLKFIKLEKYINTIYLRRND